MRTSMIVLATGLIALYVILRVVLPARMRPSLKVLASLVVLVSAERLLIIRMMLGTMGASLPQAVLLVTSFFQILVLMLFLLALLRDGVRLTFWLAHQASDRFLRKPPAAGLFRRMARFIPQSLMLTLFAALLTGYSMYEALRVPSIREVQLSIPGLPPALNGLRIVQLSDLHIGSAFEEEWLRQVVQRANALHPDLTVITGDLVDGSPKRLKRDIAPLKDLRAQYGVYITVGNHEYYSGLEAWLKAFRTMGIPVLLNRHVVLDVQGTPLILAGTTDPAASFYGDTQPMPEQVMKEIRQRYGNSTTIMLAHAPNLASRSAKAGASAQLSGHTHGGLVLPLSPLIAWFNSGYVRGLYKVDSMPLYVSSGSGLWGGLPLRLLVPSEITLITLSPGSKE